MSTFGHLFYVLGCAPEAEASAAARLQTQRAGSHGPAAPKRSCRADLLQVPVAMHGPGWTCRRCPSLALLGCPRAAAEPCPAALGHNLGILLWVQPPVQVSVHRLHGLSY